MQMQMRFTGYLRLCNFTNQLYTTSSAVLGRYFTRVRYNCLALARAGFSWWEAWAQWCIWDFRKGLAIELQGFKN